MDVKGQADYAKKWVDLVAGHDDEDLAVRIGVLDDVVTHIGEAIGAAKARADERLSALLDKPLPDGSKG